MIFLAVLALATIVAGVALRNRESSTRDTARLGMAAAIVVAGVSHWLAPTPFVQHLPPWVPWAAELIFLSGLVEVALGAGLLLRPPARRIVGLGLAAYLLAVFPANVYVAVAGVDVDGQPGGWYPWLRLPLQILFVGWAVWSTQPTPPRSRTSFRGRPASTGR